MLLNSHPSSLKDSPNPIISQYGHDDVSDNKKGAYTSKHL